MVVAGGYDEGYADCSCFWGSTPGSLVSRFLDGDKKLKNTKVLDVGCGEGKNAHALALAGASVLAIDCSPLALANAKAAWPDDFGIQWLQADVKQLHFEKNTFDIVIAYGLYHCMPNNRTIEDLVAMLQSSTKLGGTHIVCTFNNRRHDLSAHPRFSPCLLPHDFYLGLYKEWDLPFVTDEDLYETHPHNNIPHYHSLTRIIAQKK